MRIAVVGSRGLAVDIAEYIPAYISEIVSGGADGIDSLAERWADENRITKLIIKPDYDRYGSCAPIHRSKIIVETAQLVVAVWNGKSQGTQFAIEYAKKIHKPVKVYLVEE